MSLVLCSMFRTYYNPSGRCNLDIWNSMAHLNTHSDSMRHRSAQKFNSLLDYCSGSQKSLRRGWNITQLATSQRGLVAQKSLLKYMRLSTHNDRGRRYVIGPLAILRSIARSRAKTSCQLERSILVRSSNAAQIFNRRHADLVCDLQEIPEGADKVSRGAYSIERFSQC
jgi:hypothetical protein